MKIKNDAELKVCLKELDDIFIITPITPSDIKDRRDILIRAILEYEEDRYPIEKPSDQEMDIFYHEQGIRTDKEKEAQRRSFAYGNCKMSNEYVTRDMVNKIADQMKGKTDG